MKQKILTVVVSEGWREGTRITFAEEGDQGPNTIPGNRFEKIFPFGRAVNISVYLIQFHSGGLQFHVHYHLSTIITVH